MKKLTNGLLTLFLAFVVQFTFAQEKEISGTISDEDGLPLPGVNIIIKGSASGTQTDFDGNYKLNASTGDVLAYSYVGYKTVEKTVGASNKISFGMEIDAQAIETVVVTALGIKREEKAIGYAIQKVKGDDLENSKETNLVNALQGRVAGIQIQGSPSSLGGSSRITIRGANSFLGENQPLFVVDGVPIDNGNFATKEQQRGFGDGAYDYGNNAADIDPSSIKSMSVLKGAAATALYGSRGANGVILITTKDGSSSKKGIGVSFNSSLTTDNVTNLIPIQQVYGGGSINKNTTHGFSELIQDGLVYKYPNYGKDGSWGPKYDENMLVRHWDSWDPASSNYKEVRPWVAPTNSYEAFFKTGITLTNSIGISGNNEKGNFRFGYTKLDQSSTMPGGGLDRNSLNLNSSYNFTPKLKVGTTVNYVNTAAENRNATGYNNSNPMQAFTQWFQSQVDVKRLERQQLTASNKHYTWNAKGPIVDDNKNFVGYNFAPNYFDNPYWLRNNYLQEDVRNRVFGNANLSYEIMEGLTFTSQFGTDFYQFSAREGIPQQSVLTSKYAETERRFQENNFEARLNLNKNLSEKITFTGILGTNSMRNTFRETKMNTSGGIVIDKFFNIANSKQNPTQETLEKRKGINSLFATASTGFNNLVFLDLSGRMDFSSTLPKGKNNYFYPAASLSFALSEIPVIKESKAISFAKLRGSYAQAGNDADPYNLVNVYKPDNPNLGNNPLYNVPNAKNNSNLKNELTTEVEVGLDVRLFSNRLSFDAAYFDRSTKDQIFRVPTSAATGFTSRIANAGEMRNWGYEFQLSGSPIATENFTWEIGINATRQNNEVVELLKDENGKTLVESIQLGRNWAADLRIAEGLPYMAIFGNDYVYDANGNKVVGEDGSYKFTDDRVFLGSAMPDWTGGFNTSFTYKSITLSGLFDFQVGGYIHSTSLQWSKYSGMHPETVAFNGESDTRANGMILPGVKEDGSTNDIKIDPQTYYQNHYNKAAPNLYEASFLKFREMRLAYDFPKKLIGNTPLSKLSLGVFGRNLAILYSKLPYLDPQGVSSSGNIQGLENAQVPSTRSVGFNVTANF